MTHLPVREMVLYKNGIGFFRREGSFSGAQAELTFRVDEINDILKSLAILDGAGGQVLGIQYQTPMDVEARLANTSIHLSDHASLSDLLKNLRGRRAALALENTPGSIETASGRVIGIDEGSDDEQTSANSDGTRLTILSDGGTVSVFKLANLRSLEILDAQANHDLGYFLDTSMSEGFRRTVNIRLSEGEHQLAVYYVAPSPTWRVSYRIVAESGEDGDSGTALLQGWGLFDNRLEEDLENVKLTLVAGQPISFVYELFVSRIPARPFIQDEARIAPGPLEFADAELALADAPQPQAFLSSHMEKRQPVATRQAAPGGMTLQAASAPLAPAVETKDTGELFEYAVSTPVTVKRGESALVPIISSEVAYQRELLYNAAKLPEHPVAALRFTNSTGLTVERGPVTLVENGDYKGEAIIPFTKDGGSIYLPYAVELGVKVSPSTAFKTETNALSIQDGFLVIHEFHIVENSFTLENSTTKPVTVTVEAAKQPRHELFDTRAPDSETAGERRWRVDVPARKIAAFTIKERRVVARRQALKELQYKQLHDYLKRQLLDQQVFDKLETLLSAIEKVGSAEKQKDKLANETADLYAQQEQLRANLTVLQPTGQEAALRSRILGQLEASQNRLEAIAAEVRALDQAIAEDNARIQQILEALG